MHRFVTLTRQLPFARKQHVLHCPASETLCQKSFQPNPGETVQKGMFPRNTELTIIPQIGVFIKKSPILCVVSFIALVWNDFKSLIFCGIEQSKTALEESTRNCCAEKWFAFSKTFGKELNPVRGWSMHFVVSIIMSNAKNDSGDYGAFCQSCASPGPSNIPNTDGKGT